MPHTPFRMPIARTFVKEKERRFYNLYIYGDLERTFLINSPAWRDGMEMELSWGTPWVVMLGVGMSLL
jgi:hypothetical protein